MHLALLNVLALAALADNLLTLVAVAMCFSLPYFFLLATVRLGPLRVRALVLER